jgi:hypothetical protein
LKVESGKLRKKQIEIEIVFVTIFYVIKNSEKYCSHIKSTSNAHVNVLKFLMEKGCGQSKKKIMTNYVYADNDR